MRKLFFSLFLTVLITQNSNGQNKAVILSYNIPTKGLSELSIQKLGLRVVFSTDPDFSFPIKSKRSRIVKLDLLTRGLYKIGDGFGGHIIYLEEGDTIAISLKEIPDLNKILASGKYLDYFNNLSAKGKNKWHYLFFDEFEKRTEKLYPKTKIEIIKDVMQFKKQCDKALLLGSNLLDSLYKEKIVSLNFKTVVQQELNAMYVSRMCTPLSSVSKMKINPNYFDILSTLKFNDSSFAVMCNDYLQAGALYTYYIHNNYNVKTRSSNLENEIKSILKNYSGIVKDKLLSWQIEDYIGKDYKSFDSCYQVFLVECKNLDLKNSVIKKVNSYVKPSNSFPKIKIEDVLIKAKIQDKSDNKSTLFIKCKDSIPTLIDCWATWCIPCRDQMPFMDDFEKKYKDKLNVIYLSFDKDEVKWKTFLKKNKLNNNQFIIDNDFGSEFSNYFEIQSIPRYILISKGGIKVLNPNMPLPSLQEEFEEELIKHLDL